MNKNIKDYIIKIRRKIHEYPELGFKEFKTEKLVIAELKKSGVKVIKTKSRTGVVGIINGTKKSSVKKVIAFRADMDALPIKEETNKKYKSKIKGQMHACGHDSHVAMLLGLAKVLSKKKEEFSSTIKLIFQPSEEISYGAIHMIKEGCLKNPKPNAIFGLHVSPALDSGCIGLKYGSMMAGVDKFTVVFRGSGGHAALPHKTQDVVVCSAVFVNDIQTIVSREISPVEPAVVTVGSIHGGEAFNIIPKEVKIEGTIRTVNKNTRKKVYNSLKRRLKYTALSHGVDYTLKIEALGEPLINDTTLTKKVEKISKKLFGNKKVVLLKNSSMGGEDFAEYLKYIPGCFIYLGTANKKDTSYSWHNPKFDIDEDSLSVGVTLLESICQVAELPSS